MKSRIIAISVLVGLGVGLVLVFVFPRLLLTGFIFTRLFNEQVASPSYSGTTGSPYNSLMIVPLFTGLIGGLIGWVVTKLTREKNLV
jgi:hypothetical protein